jgi:hypothetical protein
VTTPSVSSGEPVKPEDILKEKIIDAIIPSNTTPKKPDAGQPPQTEERPPKTPEKQIEEEIQNQLRKGLDNLFKKR